MDWHAKSEEEILELLKTSHLGLSKSERETRLRRYGRNELRREPKLRLFKLIVSQLKSPLVLALILAGIISVFLNKNTDALVIFIAIFINTAIGVIQEGRASGAFEKIRASLQKYASVYIDGEERRMDAAELVPGDIIILRTGDQVPADGRILEAKGLKINEASLTGEWLPVEKKPGILEKKIHFLERSNLVWAGTLAAEGWALVAVTTTGEKTELGKIASEVKDGLETPTPFQLGIKQVSKAIGHIVLGGILLIFIIGLLRGFPITEILFLTVAVGVATVPEGLPVAVTVILALGMERMLKAGALVRKLPAAETLGSASVLLTDKTGTLTTGQMQASGIVTAEEILIHKKYQGDGLLKELPVSHLEALLVGMFTSDVVVENLGQTLAELKIHGRPTDVALFRAAAEAGLDYKELLKKHPRLDFLPFDSERRFAASLQSYEKGARIFVAGAPEAILERAWYFNGTSEAHKLIPEGKNALESAGEELSGGGARVLALAFKDSNLKELPHEPDHVFHELTFVGFIAFRDPLRSDARATLSEAKNANLKIVMLTGDHKNTAEKIAAQAGFGALKTMEGEELENIAPEDLKKRIQEINVFARVLPHQKTKIVSAWKERNEVVAMTGDGVNDAPALKRADIGIALGSGTDVAKEASEIVLLNDDLKVIVKAIEEGRVILDNIRKVITYLLSTGFTELILVAGSLSLGLPLPVLPIQILWANLVQEGFMNFAFAFEPKEKDIASRDPRRENSKKLITSEMFALIFGIGIITDLILFALFLYLLDIKYPFEKVRTLMFLGLSTNAVFFAFALKSLRRPLWKINIFSNPYLIFALALSIFLLVGAVTMEPLRKLLNLVPISAAEFGVIVALGVLDLILIEIVKYYFIFHEQK